MSDVRGYIPGQTGSLSDVIERGPELTPFTPAGPDGFKAPPGFGELFRAARPEALRATPGYDDAKIGEGYAPIVDALGLPTSENPGYFGDLDAAGEARFGFAGSPSELATDAQVGVQVPFSRNRMADRTLQESLIVGRIRARRAKEPDFLAGLPDTVEGLRAYFEQQQAKKRAAGAEVLARGSFFGRTGASIAAGGLESAVHDPAFLPSLLIGGGTASSVVQAVGRDALINGVLSAAQLPQQAANMAENDEHLTAGQAAEQVVGGAIFGGLFGGAVHLGAAHLPPLLFKAMPESVQARWASRMKVGDVKLADVLGDMDNRELAGFARSAIGEHMSGEEKAAADTLERSQELGDASPFEPGPVGDAAHNASLANAIKAMVDGDRRGSARADLLGSSSTIGLRAPEPVAVPVDAGFDAQWAAIKGNEHGIGAHGEFLTSPKGAVGPAQVMPGTAPYAAKLAGLPWDEARYRGDAAYNEALGRAYYAEQLKTFDDPDMAAAAYNAGPGSAARGTGLRGALRKAAEHGEPGNWRAYLPHETQRYVEDFRRRMGAAAEAGEPAAIGDAEGELAALQRSAAEAEAEGLALSLERDGLEAGVTREGVDVADVPVLKRELFPDDQSWADAQAAFHQSLNAPEEPAGRPLSAETAAVAAGEPEVPEGAREAAGDVYRIVDSQSGDEVVAVTQDFADALARQRALNDGAEARNGVPRYLIGKVALSGSGPLTREELELLRPAGRDALWLAGHQMVTSEDFGRAAEPIWGVRDPETGELVSWAMKKAAAERARADQWDPERLEIEKLAPQVVTAELRDRLANIQAARTAADVHLDDPDLKAFDAPGGEGAQGTVDSLDHDYRMAAADPELSKRTYQLDESGKARTLLDILADLDADRDAAAALRACAGAT